MNKRRKKGKPAKLDVDDKDQKKGFLFGAPVGTGDCFHSGHSFHDNFSFNYMRLYNQSKGIRKVLIEISSEIRSFIQSNSIESENHVQAVAKYLTNEGIIKRDFCALIRKDLNSAIESNNFKYFTRYLLASDNEVHSSEEILNQEDTPLKRVNDFILPSIAQSKLSFFNTNNTNFSTPPHNQSDMSNQSMIKIDC